MNSISFSDFRNGSTKDLKVLMESGPVLVHTGKRNHETIAVLVPYDQYIKDQNLLAGFKAAVKEGYVG